jgi:hypothetical protein
VPLSRSLLQSLAWRSLSANGLRLIQFLMIEHMNHGGKKNGFLLAPRRQLESFGMATHLVSAAIAEAERIGLIDVIRGRGRAPNRYALTWLPLAGEPEPTDRWRRCDQQATSAMVARKQAKTRQKRKIVAKPTFVLITGK